MSFQSFPFSFVTGGAPIVNQQNGQPTSYFYRFMQAIYNRTGMGTGIVPSVSGSLTAQGSDQSSALMLGSDWNQVASVPSGAGVVMPPMKPGNDISVWNSGGGSLKIYPFSGASINSMAANSPYSLAPGGLAYFQCWTTTQLLLAYLTTV